MKQRFVIDEAIALGMTAAVQRALWRAALFGLALLIAACDYFALQELQPGRSTGAEVRERLGVPTMEWKNMDGTTTWEFSRQPEGTENYMVVMGPDDVLREIRQVLTEQNLARIEKGMSEDNVRRLLGRPAARTPFPLKQEVVWDWNFNSATGRRLRFHVHFDQTGHVLGTSRSEEHFPS